MKYTMQYDPSTRELVYPSDKAAVIRHYVPDAQAVNGHVRVPANLANSQILHWLGFSVRNPMVDYDWPRAPGIEPFASQKHRAAFLMLNPRALDLSDMGTGKTLTALWAADALMRQHPRGTFRAIITAPLSSLRDTWEREIFTNFMGKRSAVVLYGDAKKRERLLEQEADFYIVNHDGLVGASATRRGIVLRGFAAALAERDDIKLVILDEISVYRNYTIDRAKVVRHLLGHKDYIYGLTGTPTPNAPTDAYGLVKIINPAWPETLTQCKDRLMFKVGQWKWLPKPNAYVTARQMLVPSIRYSLEECVDLPEMVTSEREVEFTPQQKELWKKLKAEVHAVIQGNHIDIANEAALRSKLLQMSSGAVYDSRHVAHPVDCKTRLAVLKEVIEESASKVVIFAPFTSIVHMLHLLLRQYSRAIITSEVNEKDRADIISRFRTTKDPHLLIGDPRCMSHALNLQEASTTIWYTPTDMAEAYQQANKRTRRPGQKHVQRVVHIVSNPLEKETFKRLQRKESLQGVLMKLVEEGKL